MKKSSSRNSESRVVVSHGVAALAARFPLADAIQARRLVREPALRVTGELVGEAHRKLQGDRRRRQVQAILAASVAGGPPEKAGEHEVPVASDSDQPGEERGLSAVSDEGGADRRRGRTEIRFVGA
jgi:hypothetical protein